MISASAGYDTKPYRDYLARIEPFVIKEKGQIYKTHPPIPVRLERIDFVRKEMGLESVKLAVMERRFRNAIQP